MSTTYSRAPHIQGPERQRHPSEAPNAALLVDFDNVTMGMRSDLSRELKSLLNSDIIKGKVTVQRAYADWRRYPQYIVPLSEASIDLIFAPAYGSSKKNATDIRMAIDGMELVFTRPEIGTYILLTGDSDFSSLVLKLKEYGKYVIGVGIQESSSDILVQNCDEYYSYTSISGLRKSTDAPSGSADPWVLVEKAVDRMVSRNDVMRSDRLKQVMLELDSGFDEKGLGFSKFSRFLTEAASKGILQLRKMENGQYEIRKGGTSASSRGSAAGRGRDGSSKDSSSRDRSGRDGSRRRTSASPSSRSGVEEEGTATGDRTQLQPAYDLLLRAVDDLLTDQEGDSVRDSDVKRRMLALDPGFDEAELGFGKFSLFLRQAHDQEVITLRKGDEGNYHVSPAAHPAARDVTPGPTAAPPTRGSGDGPGRDRPAASTSASAGPSDDESEVRRLRPRMSVGGSRGGDEPPPILEGQVVGTSGGGRGSAGASAAAGAGRPSGGEVLSPEALRLPTDRDSVIKYLSNSYGGVGEKTAETLVDTLGRRLWEVLQTTPGKVEELLPPARAEKVLEGWKADFARRRERYLKEGDRGGSSSARGTRNGPAKGGAGATPPAATGAARPASREPARAASGSPAAGEAAAGATPGAPSGGDSAQAVPPAPEEGAQRESEPREEPAEAPEEDKEESSLFGLGLFRRRGRRGREGS